MNSPVLKNSLVIAMMALLSFPLIQDITHILKPIPLHGAIIEPVYKEFSWQSWWSGTYQDTMAEYAKGKTGVRPDLVRLMNQLDYSLFNIAHANSVVIGRNGYLYEEGYIDHYCGTLKMSYNEWAEKLYKLKQVQDTLSKLGIYTVVLQAGSKASYYPEYFPADRRCDDRPENDHDLLNRISDSMGLHYIDFNKWFVSMKGKAGGDLFTKQGMHWSKYASTMAADSFVRYMQHTGGINLPDLKWVKGDPWYVPKSSDIDIFQGINLMMEPEKDTFYYPYIWYDEENREKPKMIFIADSYMWTWLQQDIPNHLSDDWEFWYYNTTVWTTKHPTQKMENYDWASHLLQSRCVVLMFSECNISSVGWQFIERSYDHFYVKKPV